MMCEKDRTFINLGGIYKIEATETDTPKPQNCKS